MLINAQSNPLIIIKAWLLDAAKTSDMRYPNAFCLSTSADSLPDSRIVLYKLFNDEHGYLSFFTNYESKKGLDLETNNAAAAVFYWDKLGRQLRLKGKCVKSPVSESDDYFASRPILNQLNAKLSQQSQPIESLNILNDKLIAEQDTIQKNNVSFIDRPNHWGGFRLYFSSVEFWEAGEGRFHQRYLFQRTLSFDSKDNLEAKNWKFCILQP